MAITAQTRTELVQLVVSMLGEAPSTAMLTDLVTKANAGSTVQELADSLATNAAFTSQFPIWMTASEFTSKVVTSMFAGSSVSAADTDAAVDYIAGMITAGTFTKTSAVVALTSYLASADGVANATYGTAAQSYQNKVEVAEYYTITSGQGGATAAERKAAISGVTATTDVTATTATIKAEGEAAAIEAAKIPGNVITLKNAAETLNGGGGDDTFVAVVAGDGATTATSILPGDVINGGGGIDTLSINTSGALTGDYSISAIQATGLEKISFNAFETDDTGGREHTIDLTLMGSDITDVELASSGIGGDIIVTGAKSIINAAMKNGSGDLGITYGVATVIGTADTQKLEIANITGGTATFAGIETMDVTTSLAKSTLGALTATGMTNLNVSGDQKLTITAALDFKDTLLGSTKTDGTIDASGSTGGVDLTLTSADNLAVTGSSGDDSIRFGTQKNYYDTIDGGEGEDTLFVSASGAIGAAVAQSYSLAGISNVETLDVTSTNDATIVDMTSLSADIKTVNVASEATATYQVTAVANSAAIAFSVNGVSFTTAATDTSATAAEAAALMKGVIDANEGFTATVSTDTITITAAGTKAASNTIQVVTPTGGATAGTFGTLKNVTVRDLADDGSSAVEIHSGGDVTLSLADGSGTADVVNATLNSITVDKGFKKTVDTLTIANTETLNLTSSGNTDTIDHVITTLTADNSLTTITVAGDSDLDLSGTVTAALLSTIDASTMTGDLTIDVPAHALAAGSTVTGGTGKDSFIFTASGLRNNDTVKGGEGTDKLSADVTSYTGAAAGRGALNVDGVETLNLTNTGTTEIDAAGIVGATDITISGAATKTTLSNLDGTTKVGFGVYKTDGASSGRADLALADATGAEDAIGIVLNDTNGGNTNALELRASGIETANISFGYNAATDTALANHTLDVDKLNVAAITVTGSTYDVGNTLSLATLDTDTTSVDASTYSGILTVSAGAATATTITAKADRTHNITGSSKNDTFTLAGSTTGAQLTLDGGAGSGDVLNMTLGDGVQDFSEILNVETINLTVSGSSDITTNAAADDLDGLNLAAQVNITGGNSLSSVILGGNTDVLTGEAGATKSNVIDASAYKGVLTAFYGADAFDDLELGRTQQLIGTASITDAVTASYTNADDTVAINMQGIEVLNLSVTNGSALAASLAKVTGLSEINFTDASGELVSFSGYDLATTMDATTTNNTSVTITPTDATGAADTLKVKAKAGTGDDVLKLVAADVETISIKADSANQVNLDVSGITMTALGATNALVFTGANDIEITADNADIASIDATANSGGVIQTVRAKTGAFTSTGGIANDTFIMMNEADVLAGGLGTDTLTITKTAILGGLSVNLAAADQVTAWNGGVPSGTVAGFENVDASGYGGFGAQLIGNTLTASTLTGTANIDSITGGAAGDTITGGAGADALAGGGGNDSFTGYTATAQFVGSNAVVDSIAGGSGTGDKVVIDNNGGATFTIAATDDLARMSGVEIIQAAGGTDKIVTVTLHADAYTDGLREIDLSLDTTTTSDNVIDADLVTGGGIIMKGGAGIETMTGSGGADTFTPGVGANIIKFKSTLVAGDTAADAGDLAGSLAPAGDTITTYVAGTDTHQIDETIFGVMGNGTSGNGSAIPQAQFANVATGAIDLTGNISDAAGALDVGGNGALVYVADDKKLYFVEPSATLTAGGMDAMAAAEIVLLATYGTVTGTMVAAEFDVIA